MTDLNELIRTLTLGDEAADHPLALVCADPARHPIARLRAIQVELFKCCQQFEAMAQSPEEYTVHDARAVSRHARHLKGLAALEFQQLRREGPPLCGAGHPQVPLMLDHLFKKVVGIAHQVLPATHAQAFEDGLRQALDLDPAIPWPPTPRATP